MTACAYRIPDTAGGEHDCERPAVASWSHVITGDVALCGRHDTKAQAACHRDSHLARQWTRTECPQTLQEGPGRPEAAGAA